MNEVAGTPVADITARQVLHRRPGHRLAVDGRGRHRRRGEVRRRASPTTRSRTSRPSATPCRLHRARPRPDRPVVGRRPHPGRRPRAAPPPEQGATRMTTQRASSSPAWARPRPSAATSPPPGTACSPGGRASARSRATGSPSCPCASPASRRRPERACSSGRGRAGSTGRQQLALIAAREAWADAGAPEVDPLRLGVVGGLRHRRRRDPARAVRHAQGDAAGAGSPR